MGNFGYIRTETYVVNIDIEQSVSCKSRFKITVTYAEDKNLSTQSCVVDIARYVIYICCASNNCGRDLCSIALKQFKQDYMFADNSASNRERSMYVKRGDEIIYYEADSYECNYGDELQQLCYMNDISHDPKMQEVEIVQTLKNLKLEEKTYYFFPVKYDIINKDKDKDKDKDKK